jgi:hypothetical protein
MFQLIKTELSYNKKYTIIGIVFCCIFLLAYIMSGRIERESIRYTTFSIAFWMFFFSRWGYYIFNKDNLERVHASLPLSFKTIAKARLVPGIILWFMFLSIVAVTLVSGSYFTSNTIISILFINGLALSMNAFIFVWHDWVFINPGKLKRIVSYSVYYVITFLIIGIVYLSTSTTFPGIESIQDEFRTYVFTYQSAFITNSLAIVITILSIYTYQRRSSYLKSEFGLKSNIKVKTGDIT